jgi:GNAT superfamily N-acetyltransferase
MAKAASHALKAILDAAAAGQFPAPDGRVTILAQLSARDAGVIAFAGHSVIFADADPTWVVSQLAASDLAAPLSPPFLHALAERTGRVAHATDMLTCAAALPGAPDIDLTPEPDHGHPRIARALGYRDDVRAWQAAGGVLLLGRGVAGRWEAALEVADEDRGRGLGRALALAARHLVPDGGPLWAQIAPGNAASVRAFLAAGFRPMGAEALLTAR